MKNNIIKLEFTKIYPEQKFTINNCYINECETENSDNKSKCYLHLNATAKIAGKINNDYFTAKVKFVIKSNKICEINIIKIIRIGKSKIPKSEEEEDIYYSITSSSSSSSSLNDDFELKIFEELQLIFKNATVEKTDNLIFVVTLKLQTYLIDNMYMDININCSTFSSSSSSESCRSSKLKIFKLLNLKKMNILKIIGWSTLLIFVIVLLNYNKFEILNIQIKKLKSLNYNFF